MKIFHSVITLITLYSVESLINCLTAATSKGQIVEAKTKICSHAKGLHSELRAAISSYTLEERDYDSNELLSSARVRPETDSFLDLDKSAKQRPILSRVKLTNILKTVFLPSGFPHSVPLEYANYQKWNLIQDACSYLRGIMSTQAILTGMGVGRSDITALQATVQWVLRDGASMLGGLLFTTFSSANFGQNVKSWRLFADFINNLGITLDMIAPLLGKNFLPVICVASVCKALCGIAAGATNSVIAEHWGSKNGNMADVQAKNGAQHTMVNLLGLMMSVRFARFASSTPERVWSTYIALTLLHMYSNYHAMRILALRSLNIARYSILVNTFLDSSPVNALCQLLTSPLVGDQLELDRALEHVKSWAQEERSLSLQNVAKKEPILSLISPFKTVGKALSAFFHHYTPRKGTSQTVDKRLLMTPKELDAFINSAGEMSMIDNVHLWAPPAAVASHFTADELQRSLHFYDKLHYFIISRGITNAPSNSGGTAGTGTGTGGKGSHHSYSSANHWINHSSAPHEASTSTSHSPLLPHASKPAIKSHHASPVYVCFKRGCTLGDQARATFEALVYDRTRQPSLARVLTLNVFPVFWASLQEKGWDETRVLLRPQRACVFDIANKSP